MVYSDRCEVSQRVCDKAHSEAVGPDGLTTKTNRLINAIKFATREYLS